MSYLWLYWATANANPTFLTEIMVKNSIVKESQDKENTLVT